MTLVSNALQQFPLLEAWVNQSYRGLQWSKGYFSLLHRTVAGRIEELLYPSFPTEPLHPDLLRQLQQRVEDLLDQDWQDAKAGVYPVDLLFEEAWDEFFQSYPRLWADLPRAWQRAHGQRGQDFDPEIDLTDYPPYYLQNFHYQTNGYLSDESAQLYDHQVELLFGGKADAMRRRILSPLKQGLQQAFPDLSPRQVRILDVGCGTGQTLKQLRACFPEAQLHGVDLSMAYLRKANQRLSHQSQTLPQLIAANAEQMPFAPSTFQGLSVVFVFHELPGPARQAVLAECHRVLQPGGTLVICDSIQEQDSPDFLPMMLNFATRFHEPYYRHYVQDDLTARITQAGFTVIETSVHFLSKFIVAQRL
ncbi:class I SAM-dependent methyltransferase [Lyngbya confervoides]|uniref:Methyltransferase domain-containing protein n=1 Tax=Lyngbya confervoides BDU141951 TaxID=1574623 RepID=A0ABD4T983_9CYAN|nr:class I SAM-dependent methyltransferase [Lyngbya confervoides]MCM1984882.1 methyltransferase domain-containing protein [Lyngbya confervoides BDU141951]